MGAAGAQTAVFCCPLVAAAPCGADRTFLSVCLCSHACTPVYLQCCPVLGAVCTCVCDCRFPGVCARYCVHQCMGDRALS